MSEVFEAFWAEVLQMMDYVSIWARCGGVGLAIRKVKDSAQALPH